MAVEPISISLAALAILDPAIKACRKAYGVYRLTKNFGEHYVGVQHRFDAGKARLEVIVEAQLSFIPNGNLVSDIKRELGYMRKNF